MEIFESSQYCQLVTMPFSTYTYIIDGSQDLRIGPVNAIHPLKQLKAYALSLKNGPRSLISNHRLSRDAVMG